MAAVGYSAIQNSVAQDIATNVTVNLGYFTITSCANNISTFNGQVLTVNRDGVYHINTQVIGTPTASLPVTLNINVNGVPRASITVVAGATPVETIYEVRGIFYLEHGDVITVTNTGTASLALAVPAGINGYNVSTMIERYI